MPAFVIESGPQSGRRIPLERDVVVGRGTLPDVALSHPTVSRRHAAVRITDGDRCSITDLGSDNGTYVNQHQIREPTSLRNGDRVRIGAIELRYEIEEEAPPGTVVSYSDDTAPKGVVHVSADWKEADRELGDRLRVLYEVGEALSGTLDEEALLGRVLDSVFSFFPQAERGFIVVRAEEGDGLVMRAARTRQGAVREIGVSRTLVNDALQSRQAILSADAVGDNRIQTSETLIALKLRTLVCVPMVAQDKAWGVLQLDSSVSTRPFEKEDVPLLMAIASQAALALAGARMHSRLVRQELLEQDLQHATRIQLQFLPLCPPKVAGWEFADKYRAALEVGGDYYDFLELGGGWVGVAVGDVCGKGVPAALYMARLSSEVRYQSVGQMDPAGITQRVNRSLCRDGGDDMFVTLVIAAIEPSTGKVHFSSAGHLPPLVRRRDGRVETIDVTGAPPAGIMGDVGFHTTTCQLDPGDVAILYTDGVTEAMGPGAEEFGDDRLIEAVGRAEGTPEGIVTSIVDAIDEFVGDEVQSDDTAVVCFGRTG